MRTFSPIDALDIIIVAFFLFKLMMMLRGTRATSIIKGLAVLFAANVVSRFIGLRTVHWILEQGTTVILIALPVVFYPELRRALEHLGRGQLFARISSLGGESVEQSIDTIARSARLLAESKTGALIVWEQDVGLEEYVASGVRLDARLSPELLLNIFVVNTPLHDGAVIVRNDRVVAAGCFLPLTDNPYIDSKLGARHRAALGITEHSDAIVIVTSEETGTISFVQGGKLERDLDERTLRERLHQELPSSPRGMFGRRERRSY